YSSYTHTLFFFQAEDSIRYRNVTGVQTCALPISLFVSLFDLPPLATGESCVSFEMHLNSYHFHRGQLDGQVRATIIAQLSTLGQIGRASCRERVWVSVWGSTV